MTLHCYMLKRAGEKTAKSTSGEITEIEDVKGRTTSSSGSSGSRSACIILLLLGLHSEKGIMVIDRRKHVRIVRSTFASCNLDSRRQVVANCSDIRGRIVVNYFLRLLRHLGRGSRSCDRSVCIQEVAENIARDFTFVTKYFR